MHIKGVVFDLDGTLVHSAPDIRNALNQFLTSRGRRPVSVQETEQAIGDGTAKLVERIMGLTGPMPPNLAEETQAFIAIYRNLKPDPAQIYPYVLEILQELRGQGLSLGLCTNKPLQATQNLLRGLQLTDYFSAIAGGDSFAVSKPNPEHLRGTIRMMNLQTEHCVMVGDSINDAVAAARANIPSIMVDYGYNHGQTFPTAAATINSMAQLPQVLRELANP
jgi:phosphoglycolate phosphatase